MNFINKLKHTQNNQYDYTENEAIGYQTTGKYLLDLHFGVASLRKASETEITHRFMKAYYEDKKLAVKWLFYARDIRNGLGERRLFRILFGYLAENSDDSSLQELIELIPEYGRFDDLLELLDTPYQNTVLEQIEKQFRADLNGFVQKEPISLLAKWLPSINASSRQSKVRGRFIASKLGMNEKEYRKSLSALRGYLDIVERKMSSKEFDQINYEAVPSKANLIYKDAFLHHDVERRTAYLISLKNSEANIHSGDLYPHEIVHAYMNHYSLARYDETLEQLWNALDNTKQKLENTIVVADGSGSMFVPVGNGSCTALSVANALAIYFAERSEGQFKNHYITFSQNPQLVDLSNAKTLREKLGIALAYNEVANTNMEKVFKLILQTALDNNMKQSELPKNIVIISDMEFDSCTENATKPLFTSIAKEYQKHGYLLPRLIFWNVNSRSGVIPVKENKLGVALVSGFSVHVLNMLLSDELDPYQCLVKILNSERYEVLEDILNKAV